MEFSTLAVAVASSTYPITIGRGARHTLRERLASFGAVGRISVISDSNVAPLWADAIRDVVEVGFVEVIPAGEESKTLRTAERLYDAFGREGLGRGDLILALGGGVVGDLAGFVAATWHRGLRFVQLPTTLEAAVDASVGGKTGVNHAAGKNLIGAFHQPAAVVIDTEFLDTLSERDFRAGLAESVKHAAIRDAEFFEWHEQHAAAILARDPDALESLIRRNCEIKADVVAQDEREAGLRAILNYGHTVGHAIEHAAGYALRHGECVAIGMVAENHAATGLGLMSVAEAARVSALLGAMGLPTRVPPGAGVEADTVVRLCRGDKKSRGGQVRAALVDRIGRAQEAVVLSEDVLRAAALAVIGGE
ncbi:MAG: 3-dehydroquinate synthase [Planctomycetia bacterium]|nr:MAG: 3-dehydroquinate synthase [Planctomycetia bacterium]